MNLLKNKPVKKAVNITLLALLSSSLSIVHAGDNVTICHSPSSSNPETLSINLNDWNHHQRHGDIPGACGILVDEGAFSDKPVFYALSDDSDIMNVYTFGSPDVIPISGIKFPDELENLTEAQGGTYYALTARSSGLASLYEITVKQKDDCSFTSSYIEVFNNFRARDYNALELIDGEFYAPNNKQNKWVKFGLDGTIIAERSFDSTMRNIPRKVRDKKIEDTAYDPVNKILYATHVWHKYKHNKTHLLAFDLSNGFKNMVAIDKGTIFWEKIEGLLFKNGVLYGSAGHEDVIFEIIQDDNGNIVGDGKGNLFPGWDGDQAADLEGLANAFLNTNCTEPPPIAAAPPPLDFGTEGRFNIRELNTHKVVEQYDGGEEVSVEQQHNDKNKHKDKYN